MGPHGPEDLTYELVRTVLRDDRFVMPKGLALAAQGITSGELWDISLRGLLSLDGADHHRQRPNIRVAGPVPWKSITGITGPASLPVEFTTCP
jgi:hypothetical protein